MLIWFKLHLITVGEAAEKSTLQAFEKGRWQVCVDYSTKALEVGPNSERLRRLRVNCATELGDVNMVYGDLRLVSSLCERLKWLTCCAADWHR